MKKTIKPTYIVDITNVSTIEEAKTVIALAKHNAGLALTNDELKSIVLYTVNLVPTERVCDVNVEVYEVAKKPWYKRFWNWVTRKKN